ncbi:hypothetical protein [Desulfosporosinus sp. BG]|uniref:hypothetical protein n=1 Tax=Desulfosporosinus sp. BG TaxID=1633135 RepID=UPI0008563702|nr:hypothetical protein [Desulfosporosinus sp. BG]ODA39938.1 hypothetical protein DSBG_3312 [Desulfosporosinus sp. BG]
MWQGYCTYSYTLFTLEGGVEHVVRSNTIGFDAALRNSASPAFFVFISGVDLGVGQLVEEMGSIC